jgi:hypothetical protein
MPFRAAGAVARRSTPPMTPRSNHLRAHALPPILRAAAGVPPRTTRRADNVSQPH